MIRHLGKITHLSGIAGTAVRRAKHSLHKNVEDVPGPAANHRTASPLRQRRIE